MEQLIRNGMTCLIISMATIAMISCGQEGSGNSNSGAVIAFDTTRYDFGEIAFGGDGTCLFRFENTGRSPLMVTHVKSTCGCTIPEWSKEPVQPGEKGTIRVVYDTRRSGAFNKSIYVYSNASNGAHRLFISGQVLPEEITANQ